MTNETQEAVVTQIEPLSDEDRAQMDSRRQWIGQYPNFAGDLNTVEGKLALIEAVLKDEKAMAGGAFTVQTLGVVLGDAIAQQKGMRWYMMTAAMGRGPGLGIPGTSIKILPVTFIGDRINNGEAVDVEATFMFFCGAVDEMRREAGIA